MKRLVVLPLLLIGRVLVAQQMVFSMSAFGINFGTMVVAKTQEDDSTESYTLHARGYLKVLWMERNDETFYTVRYRHGRLLSSTYKQVESGHIKKWTNVVYDGSRYLVSSYRGNRTFTEVPVFSVLPLYFSHPENINRIFYEAESDFTPLLHPDKNTVEMQTSDGNRSVYHYINGVLQYMDFHISIATVYMKRIS